MINEYEAYKSLKVLIENQFKINPDPEKNWLAHSAMYKGELEEGAQWKVNLPAVFIELFREDVTKYAGAKAYTNDVYVNLFIADKNLEEPEALRHKEEIKEFMNGKLFEYQAGKFCKIVYEGSQFHAYIHGLGAAYIMNYKLMTN